MDGDHYKFLFKVVLIGNSGVGKTCLVRRFTQGVFPKGQGATIGVDFVNIAQIFRLYLLLYHITQDY